MTMRYSLTNVKQSRDRTYSQIKYIFPNGHLRHEALIAGFFLHNNIVIFYSVTVLIKITAVISAIIILSPLLVGETTLVLRWVE